MWKLSLKTYRQCRHNCWAMGCPLLVYRSKKNVHFSVPSDLWKQSQYVPSYHWEPLTQWHSVTSQKTRILRKTAVIISNLLFQHVNITEVILNFFVIKPTGCTNFTNLFCHETLHLSDCSSVHQQDFIRCTLSNVIRHTGL
jgi:hypothetical protein